MNTRMSVHVYQRPVFIVDAARTPFLKVKGRPGLQSGLDLAISAIRPMLLRHPGIAEHIEHVVAGCVVPQATEANIGRLIALRAGCPESTPGMTIQRNCASGMQAIDTAASFIASAQSDVVLAGGTEAMSYAPLLFKSEMVHFLADLAAAKTIPKKLKQLLKFRLGFLAPELSLLKGLNDPMINMSMGQTAEELMFRFGLNRSQVDEYSVQSHLRAAEAQKNNHFAELSPMFTNRGDVFTADDGVRSDSSVEKLAKLKPVFEKYGNITAGNSSQVTDGASFVLLASEEAVRKHNLPVLGLLKACSWVGLDPRVMGLGPVHAMHQLLRGTKLNLPDVDYVEINEAFAAQILACEKAWADPAFCKQYLGADAVPEQLAMDRVNVDGGAIALGHPVGASGARIVSHLLHILKRQSAKRGIASICIGGGQGGAMLLETV